MNIKLIRQTHGLYKSLVGRDCCQSYITTNQKNGCLFTEIELAFIVTKGNTDELCL